MYNLERELVQNLTGDKKHWKEDKTSNQFRMINGIGFIMNEMKCQMKALIELWNDKSTHTNNVEERDNLERGLVRNLTGDYKNWQSITHYY